MVLQCHSQPVAVFHMCITILLQWRFWTLPGWSHKGEADLPLQDHYILPG